MQKLHNKDDPMANVNTALKNESDDVSELAGVSISRHGGRSSLIGKFGVLVGAFALAGFTAGTEGSIVRDPFATWDPIARQNGINYLAGHSVGGGAAALRISSTDSNGVVATRNTSSTFLGNYVNPNTGNLQALCITAYHNYSDFNGAPSVTSSVRTGSNYLTNPGQTLNVQSTILYSGAASRDPNRADAMWMWLDGTIAGSNAVFGAPSGNLAFASFSRPGSEQMGLLPADGNVRMVLAPYDVTGGTGGSGYNGAIYNQAIVNPLNPLQGLGRESQLGSGGAVFNQFIDLPDGSRIGGQLTGMTQAGTNGTNFNGITILMDFSTPEFQSEFQLVTNVPTPGGATVVIVGALSLFGRPKRE